MDLLKELLLNSLQGMKLRDVYFVIFQLSIAGILSLSLKCLFKRKIEKQDNLYLLVPLSVLVALFSMWTQLSVSLAIGLLLVVLLFRPSFNFEKKESVLFLTSGMFAFGCGSGQVFLTLIGFMVVAAIMFVSFPSNK